MDNSIEYVDIKINVEEIKQKCRCCNNHANSCVQLDSVIKTSEKMEKTYRNFLYEITQSKFNSYQETKLPQQICNKCGVQLKNFYKFIQQTCKITQQYLKEIEEQSSLEDIKNIDNLQETLIEITAATGNNLAVQEPLIEETLNIECNVAIKEEKDKEEIDEILISTGENNDESLEERDFLNNSNTDQRSSSSSEDENSEEDAESVKDLEMDLNNKSLARSCDICHKIYRNEKFLNIHKRYTHMPEEDKLPCPLCSYKASRSSALKVHMGLMHGQDKVEEYFKPVLDSSKKYPCNLCPRSYGRKDSLRKHVRRKHLNKSSVKTDKPKKLKPPKSKEKERFLCTYCGQSYSSKCGLESHILTHTGERPFPCDICSKAFKRLKDLQLHRVIHSDEKPHQCTECGKGFKRVDKLKIHMRVHSELRPYKCNECEKTFKYPSVLRTHMHIHTGQTPFVCKTCGEAFSLRTSLNNHCLKHGHEK